ncbi:hypothetical protein [Thermococcus sp. GR4]|uniref:hypothetical protein n=1 Tax=Thermococcus sp. GR4 TaxID=1638254 RepID=UPI001431B448|nr:hypothetical protein [Thermococcus sp. GR4]NJE79601.1 hypothetical protein [Thermococcus sp. GR4]
MRYKHVSVEEAKRIAKEVFNAYMAEVNKKWEQFKKEMEGIPPEILYDPDMWEDWMTDRWIELIDEIDVDAILAKYPDVDIWLEHEEDILVAVHSSSFAVRTIDGKNFEIDPYDGFRAWKHVEFERLYLSRLPSIFRAWEGFMRLFAPELLNEEGLYFKIHPEFWLDLEVYRVAQERGGWKEGDYLDTVEVV